MSSIPATPSALPVYSGSLSARPEACTPAVPALAEDAGRILGFDVVRAIAAMAVIWVHAGRSPFWLDHNLSAAGSWGTSFLNSLAGFFVVWSLKNHAHRGLGRFAAHRVFRIYGAFVVWSLLYVLARVANFVIFGQRTTLSWDWSLLYIGCTYHLWFLPYLLIITLLTLPVVGWAIKDRRRMVSSAVGFVLVAAAILILPVPLWLMERTMVLRPAQDLYLRAPGFLLGLAIGLWMLAGFRPRVTMMHALACAGIVAIAMYLSLTTELPKHVLNRLGATAAFIITLAPWRGAVARVLGELGKLGFGVYLCHVLFVEGFVAMGLRAGLERSLGVDLAVFGISVVASFAFAWLMRRTRVLAWLIP